MNRADDRVATEALPNFLHDGENEAEAYADEMAGGGYETDEGADPISDAANMDLDAPAPVRLSRARSRRAAARRPVGGGLAIFLGVLCWLGAGGLGAAGSKVAQLANYGITPTTLFIFGAIAFATACIRRGIGETQHRMATADNGGGHEQLSAQLAELLEQQGAHEETLGVAQQILLSMQRQDEKTNNLTKAIKMYGKPLMDIANHGTELAATLAHVRTAVEAGSETARQAYSRIETQLRAAMGGTEQIARLEVSLQAVSQRLEDNEVRKSLMRLEDAFTKTQEDVKQLSRGESVDEAAKSIQHELKTATSKLHAGLEELRDGNLGGLETTVRDIQREMATVATAVSQIQAALKGGAFAAGSQRTANRAPAPAAAPSPTSAPAANAPAANDGESGGGYKTGAHKTKSKNVLGAIAKLKQMKN